MPLAAVATWPPKASGLYLRNVFTGGWITRPSGSVTLVLPSYQCCSSCGTSNGSPAIRLGRPLTAPVLAPVTKIGKPLCQVKTPPVFQPLTSVRAIRFPGASALPAPNGSSYKAVATSLCGTSVNDSFLLL